jgi:hypothetical protein
LNSYLHLREIERAEEELAANATETHKNEIPVAPS